MYRTHFDVKAGVWRIQIQVYGLFWRSVCDAGKVRGWPNVKACEEFIENTGISDVYRNARHAPSHQLWEGHAGGYQPAVAHTRRTA